AREAAEPRDDLRTLVVCRMRLPGQDDLERAPRVREQPQQALGLREEEPRALVGREATREPDRERTGIEGGGIARPRPSSKRREQGRLPPPVDVPKSPGIDGGGLLPRRLARRRLELHAGRAEQRSELARHPC